MIFSFAASLDRDARAWRGWEQIYRQAFPGDLSVHPTHDDPDLQEQGIDCMITLSSGHVIGIDQKARWPDRKTGKSYDDIALEYIGDTRTNSPGWCNKPNAVDYIAYAIMGLGQCYLLPKLQLMIAWEQHGDRWLSDPRYKQFETESIGATGDRWRSRVVCIPTYLLYRAIGFTLRQRFEPVSEP